MQAGSTIAPRDEPATTAKVILTTTNGQIQIELWAREMPLACRNFIQHCLNGYYNNTFFHRIIPGFMIQGGDPTGTGTGGQSIYGSPFKNQYHQRLKFSRRGIVAMANSGHDTNKSQFFITFGECSHLNKDHTIFGKVVGDSIYSLLSFQSLSTDSSDRPIDPPYIRKTKVVINPFDDLTIAEQKKIAEQAENNESLKQKPEQVQKKKKLKKNEIKKLKNKNKLTFENEDDDVQPAEKIKSSHDTLNDDRLSKEVAIKKQQIEFKRKQKQQQQFKKQQIINKMNEALQNQKNGNPEQINEMLQSQLNRQKKAAENSHNESSDNTVKDQVLNYNKAFNPKTGKMQIYWGQQKSIPQAQQESEDEQIKMQKLRQLQEREYQALRTDQLNFKKLKQGSQKLHRKQLVAEEKQLLSNFQKRKYQFLKKQKLGSKQDQLFNKLDKFKQKIMTQNQGNWMRHKLKFHIDSENAYSLDKKNQQRKNRNQDDDGGLKIEYD